MIEIWVEEESRKVEVTVRGETLKLSMEEAIRLKNELSRVVFTDEQRQRKGK